MIFCQISIPLIRKSQNFLLGTIGSRIQPRRPPNNSMTSSRTKEVVRKEMIGRRICLIWGLLARTLMIGRTRFAWSTIRFGTGWWRMTSASGLSRLSTRRTQPVSALSRNGTSCAPIRRWHRGKFSSPMLTFQSKLIEMWSLRTLQIISGRESRWSRQVYWSTDARKTNHSTTRAKSLPTILIDTFRTFVTTMATRFRAHLPQKSENLSRTTRSSTRKLIRSLDIKKTHTVELTT